MNRFAVDLDPGCELDYYDVSKVHISNPLNIGSFHNVNSSLNLTFDYFQLLAVL